MAKWTSDQLPMFEPTSSEASSSATSLPVSADGVSHSAMPVGPIAGWCGQAPALASRSRQRARAEGRTTRVTFGRSSAASFGSAALQSSLESRLRARLDVSGSPLFSLTWKHWPIAQQVPICAVRASARSTSASAYGSWPTPLVNDTNGSGYSYNSGNHESISLKLCGAVRLSAWPTPNTPSGGRSVSTEQMDATGRTADGRKHTASLEHAVNCRTNARVLKHWQHEFDQAYHAYLASRATED